MDFLAQWWQLVTLAVGALDIVLTIFVIGVVLEIKKEPTSALAWSLLVVFLPFVGAILFYFFGYQNVYRPLRRKSAHARRYRAGRDVPEGPAPEPGAATDDEWAGLARYADAVGAFPAVDGNRVQLYAEGQPFFDALHADIRAATHHVHIETFIFRPDDTGRALLALLAEKARAGVEVRLLVDAVGGHDLSGRLLRELEAAGGRAVTFLSVLNPLKRFRINLRNHRKVIVVDGKVAYAGGLNVGDEYRGLSKRFGHWRDTHARLEGPAVAGLQRTFLEDWDFAAREALSGPAYLPPTPPLVGGERVQVVRSGPDEPTKAIREVFFAAILKARKRVWLATPYFVPDSGLRDALALAARTGVDVRILFPLNPDKQIPYHAAQHYWDEMLPVGVRVFRYARGFMHAKALLVDDAFATTGSANFDNRSLLLNFEANVLFYDTPAVSALAAQFEADFAECRELTLAEHAKRGRARRLLEKLCWLLSPVL